MKRLILSIVAAVALAFSAKCYEKPETYFPYPLVPDSISTLQGRCDFLVTHFWDLCDIKKGFSSRAKMADAFSDYMSFMPHASARKAFRSIALFLKQLEKQPDDLLFIAQKAEEYVHSDTAMYSDELFLPFATAVANNSRIPKSDREHFAHQSHVLMATMVGTDAPPIEMTDSVGGKTTFVPDSAQITILFFNEPGADMVMARTRLDADIVATKLIKDGILKIVSVTRMEPGAEWLDVAKSMPSGWTVGANPNIGNEYDIRFYPSFYVLSAGGKILAKNMTVAKILMMLSNITVSEVQ